MSLSSGVVKKQAVRVADGEAVENHEACLAPAGRARIISQQDGTAVVEILCECGRKILLQCEC